MHPRPLCRSPTSQPRAPVFFPEHHGAGRARADAHLVFQRDGAQIVVDPAPVILQTARHQEQRQAFDTGRRLGCAREHQVHDVVGQIVLAPGDIELVARQPPRGPVRLRERADGRQVRPRLRLGQAHGGGPLAADQRRQIRGAQGRIAMYLQRDDGAHRGLRAHRKGEIGPGPDFGRGGREQQGQRLPAPGLRRGQRRPARGAELLPGGRKSGGGGHARCGQMRTLGIAHAVQRREDLARDARRALQHRRGGVAEHLFVRCRRGKAATARGLILGGPDQGDGCFVGRRHARFRSAGRGPRR